MTQTIAITGTAPENNPLFTKLRHRFACAGDRTIGEMKAQQAIRDGYEPYATPVRRNCSAKKSTAERHVTRANSLPTDNKTKAPIRKNSISGSMVAIVALCAVLLLFILFSGMRISDLNNEVSGLQRNANELRAEDRNLTLSVADIENFAAEGACNDGNMTDEVMTSNLHRAFSGE